MTASGLLLVSEVAGQLRCKHGQVYDLIKKRQLQAIIVGRRYLIPQLALDEFIRSRSTVTHVQSPRAI